MRRVLFVMIGMATLYIHSVPMEETRQLVRGYVEKLYGCDDIFDFASIRKSLHAFDRDIKMSVYLEMIEENPDDPNIVGTIVGLFDIADGWDRASYGNQEALDWARKVLRNEEEQLNTHVASEYLLLKGDVRDIDIISPHFRDYLVRRVAGTNVVDYYPSGFGVSSWFECIPSVTNTGPQGLYVHAILRQCWEKMQKDPSKIPAELLTMVVSFDAGGNPVCSVDLAKYGLTMPVLDVPVKPQAEGGTPEGGLQHSVPPREPGNRLWIPAALAALTLLIGVLYARRNKLK
ncbi:MAG: hypothetical protein FWH21_03695 [Kiritimatiellaeota bacterium]|nr:hypothetical protein [Kiritimatiellota bacterium]